MSVAISDPKPSFSLLLRDWRKRRAASQLELALRAGVSQRHVSFLESGRSQPSRPMILLLAEALDIPLRDRNDLLLAAGFAPGFQERSLSDPDLAVVGQAIERILAAQEPYPAVIFDRLYDFIGSNKAAAKLIGFLFDVTSEDDLPYVAGNALRIVIHPDGVGRRYIRNWDSVAAVMLKRLRAETVQAGASPALRDLYDEVTAYPDLPENWESRFEEEWRYPMLNVDFEKDGQSFSLFTTLTTLGAPYDVTLQELRVESFFPLDEGATAFFEGLAAS